jgi:hypothetical protein
LLDSAKISRIADAVGGLSARFDALTSRKDASITPSEYKRLVKTKNTRRLRSLRFIRRPKRMIMPD